MLTLKFTYLSLIMYSFILTFIIQNDAILFHFHPSFYKLFLKFILISHIHLDFFVKLKIILPIIFFSFGIQIFIIKII